MKKEQKRYPKRYLRYIVILIMVALIPWIVLLMTETVSLLSLLGKECVELSYVILGIAFFLIIFYGLICSYIINEILKRADDGVKSALGDDQKREICAEEMEVRVGGK